MDKEVGAEDVCDGALGSGRRASESDMVECSRTPVRTRRGRNSVPYRVIRVLDHLEAGCMIATARRLEKLSFITTLSAA